MGKDSTSNILYAIGAIGSLILAIIFAYTLAVMLIFLPSMEILDWVVILSTIFVALAMIAIYRDTGSKIPLIPFILYVVLQILTTLLLLNILFPFLLTFLDFATADLMLSWLYWIFYLIIYLTMGYSIWMTRDEIGFMATLTGLLFMIWAFLQLIIQFISYGLPPSLWNQLWLSGIVLINVFAFIYFILAMRN